MSVSPQQVEQWILQSNDPSNPENQRAAVQVLQQWSETDEASAAVLFELMRQTGSETVQFYALTALGRLSLPEQARRQLRSYLLQLHLRPATMPTFLRNKAASILAAHLVQDAASASWNSVEADLMQLAASNPQLFLQTIVSVLDEFHTVSAAADDSISNREAVLDTSGAASTTTVEQTRRLKDVLKGYYHHHHPENSSANNATTLLERLFSAVVHILAASLQLQQPTSQNAAELQLLSLQAITGFFQWTEVSFLGNGTVIQRCFDLLLYTVQAPGTTLSPPVCKAALQAWQEWVTSCTISTTGSGDASTLTSSIQSTADPKLPILRKLLERIHETTMLPYQTTGNNNDNADSVDGETMEVIIQMAVLINLAGRELLPLYEQEVLSKQPESRDAAVEALFNQVLDLFFRAFAYDDIDVSTAVLPFVTRLTLFMEEEKLEEKKDSHQGITSGMRQHLPLVLNILYNQMKYPADFQYNYEDEEDAEEEVFRTELCKVYNKLVRAAPAVCLQFLCEAFAAQLSGNNIAAKPTPDVEATLRLVYHYCEGIRPSPGLKVVMRNQTFCSLLEALHTSNIAQHPHCEVVCLYYETAVRYYPIFLQKEHTQLLAALLSAMSGTSGLQHGSSRIRSRCCYLLLRLVKSVVSLLRPFVETAVSGIQGLLSNSNLEIRPDDTLFLFETIGLLLGKTDLSAADQQRYLNTVMAPHVRSMEQILTNTPDLQNDAGYYGEVLSGSIAAMAHLSKGFSKPPDEVKAILMQSLTITLAVLEALPNSEHVRNKSMVLLQRMIQCVGRDVLPMVAKFLHTLVAHCSSDDVLFVSQVFNQVCIKFKQEAVPALDSALLPFLQKCQSLIPAQSDVSESSEAIPPHLRTEQLSVQKLAFAVLQYIVTHNATAVLISPVNSGSFQTILQTMNDGAILIEDPVVRKTCIRFFRELCSQWVLPASNGANETYRRGFLTFVCQSLVPGVFQAMMRPSFNDRDANQARVVSEFAKILFMVKSNSENDELYRQCLGNMQVAGRVHPDVVLPLREVSSVGDVEVCVKTIFNTVKRSS